MKKLSFILAIITAVCLLCSCSEEKKDGAESTQKNDGVTAGEVTGYGEHTDGMLLEVHLAILPAAIHSDYPAENEEKADLLHTAAYFLLSQRPDTAAAVGENGTGITISAPHLEKTMQLLFGEQIKLADYTQFLNPQWGDSYDAVGNTYTFTSFDPFIAGSSYYLSMDKAVETQDVGDTVVARVTLVGADGSEKIVTYRFFKTVYEKYLYYTLDAVWEG